MPTLTIEYATPAERLMLEQALAFVTQMQQVAATAPAGTVLAACEQIGLTDGRQLLRTTLAAALQGRTDATDAQKKRTARGPKGDTPVGC